MIKFIHTHANRQHPPTDPNFKANLDLSSTARWLAWTFFFKLKNLNFKIADFKIWFYVFVERRPALDPGVARHSVHQRAAPADGGEPAAEAQLHRVPGAPEAQPVRQRLLLLPGGGRGPEGSAALQQPGPRG